MGAVMDPNPRYTPGTPPCRKSRFDNPACDRVNQPHTVLFVVTNSNLC